MWNFLQQVEKYNQMAFAFFRFGFICRFFDWCGQRSPMIPYRKVSQVADWSTRGHHNLSLKLSECNDGMTSFKALHIPKLLMSDILWNQCQLHFQNQCT